METQHLVCISRNIFTFYDTLFFVSRHPLRAVIASVNNLEFTVHISIFHLSQDDPRQHHDSVKTVTHSAIRVASKLFLYRVSQQTTVSFRKLLFIDGEVECLVSSGLIWPLTSLRLSFTADSSRSDAAFVVYAFKEDIFWPRPDFPLRSLGFDATLQPVDGVIPQDRKSDVGLSLRAPLSHSLLCPSCSSNPGLPHSSVRLLRSSLLLPTLRQAANNRQPHTHTHLLELL